MLDWPGRHRRRQGHHKLLLSRGWIFEVTSGRGSKPLTTSWVFATWLILIGVTVLVVLGVVLTAR